MLFIGAWFLTAVSIRLLKLTVKGLNPLFIGAWFLTLTGNVGLTLGITKSQSPFHRGVVSDRDAT